MRPEEPCPYYLGNLLYDRRRYEDAIDLWRQAAQLDPSFPTVHRNLGLAESTRLAALRRHWPVTARRWMPIPPTPGSFTSLTNAPPLW